MFSQTVPRTSDAQPAHYPEVMNGGPASTLEHALQSAARPMACSRDEAIFLEGDPCSRLFRVVEGAVRICRFRHEGIRQIEAFYLPGDYFGFDIDTEARFTAEVTTNTTLMVAELAWVLTPTARSQAVMSAIWTLAREELRRSQNHALLLGYRHAQDRLLAFLEEMAARQHCVSCIDLPMSRQDIADYLGLTIETVSRSFTDLTRSGVIGMPRPRTVIMKKAMRARISNSFDTIPVSPRPIPMTQSN